MTEILGMYEKGEGTISGTDKLREGFKKDKSIGGTEEPGNSLRACLKKYNKKELRVFSID